MSKLLKVGKTDAWRQQFFLGYQHEQNLLLAKGILIQDADDILAHPAMIRYEEEDYKAAVESFGPYVCTEHRTYCKGVAVAKLVARWQE